MQRTNVSHGKSRLLAWFIALTLAFSIISGVGTSQSAFADENDAPATTEVAPASEDEAPVSAPQVTEPEADAAAIAAVEGEPATGADFAAAAAAELAEASAGVEPVNRAGDDKITITYHENGGKNGTKTETLNPGDRINGRPGTGFHWNGKHNIGFFYRFFAWNTEPDGSGVWYRAGQKANESLDLHAQYKTLSDFMKSYNFDDVKPEIFLNQNNDHKTKETAFPVAQPEVLKYKSTLDFKDLRDDLLMLWARIDKVTSSDGSLKATFDERIVFKTPYTVTFKSKWIIPDIPYTTDPDKPDVYKMKATDIDDYIADGVRVLSAKVKLKPSVDIGDLTFDEFMEPKLLTIAEDYDQGINAIITEKSYEEIATSKNPWVIVGGAIQLNINDIPLTKDASGLKARDQNALLIPTGSVIAKYVDQAGETISPYSKDDVLSGRARNTVAENLPKYEVGEYKITPRIIPGYEFVSVKEDKPLVGPYTMGTRSKPEEIVLVYKKIGTLIVNHVDEDGKELTESVTTTGDANAEFKVAKKKFDGYTFVKEQDGKDLTGNYIFNDTQTLTLVYKKTPGKPVAAKPALAQTGSASNQAAILAGLLTAVGGAIMIASRRRSIS